MWIGCLLFVLVWLRVRILNKQSISIVLLECCWYSYVRYGIVTAEVVSEFVIGELVHVLSNRFVFNWLLFLLMMLLLNWWLLHEMRCCLHHQTITNCVYLFVSPSYTGSVVVLIGSYGCWVCCWYQEGLLLQSLFSSLITSATSCISSYDSSIDCDFDFIVVRVLAEFSLM